MNDNRYSAKEDIERIHLWS